MSKVMQIMEEKFMPIAGRIGSQRHLVAIRDGFVSIMPLMIVGSLAVLVNNFPVKAFQNFMTNIFGENWTSVGGNVWTGTFAILALLVAATTSYHLAKSYNADGLSAAVVSLATFIILTPITPDSGLSFEWTGAQGLFVAIITALITTEVFRLLYNSKFTIKMPDGVPAGVVKSFKALIPAVVILIIVSLIQALFVLIGDTSLHEIVYNTIQKPLQSLSDSLPTALIIAFLNHILWFFGLHGTNILGPIIESIYMPLIIKNQELFSSGVSAFDVPHIVTKPFFDSFVFMGGSGTTLALIIAVFIAAKSAHYRSISSLSAPAGLFNINEPIMFGLPIVLNPMMLIPFILGPIVLTITSYFALRLGLVPKTIAMLPWTTPPIVSGYLVTGGSWRGIALQVINLTIAIILYIPFIRAVEKAEYNKQNNAA